MALAGPVHHLAQPPMARAMIEVRSRSSSSAATGISAHRDRWSRSRSRSVGFDGRLGLEAEAFAELDPVDAGPSYRRRRFPAAGWPARRNVSAVAGLGRLERGPARGASVGAFGPDLADDVGPLLPAEPLDVLIREALRQAPPPAHGQLMPRFLLDHLGAGMGRRDIRARGGRESVAKAVEPAVVVGLEHDRIRADDHLALDHRDVPAGQSGLRLDLRAVEQIEPLGRRGIRVVGMERPVGPLLETRVALEGLDQPLPVADRPGQVDELDGVADRGDRDPLAEGLEVDRLDGRPGPGDVSAQGRDGGPVVGDPEAADAAVPVGDRAGGRAGGQQLERRSRRRPEALLGPAHRPLEGLAERVGHAVRRRPEAIRVLLPGARTPRWPSARRSTARSTRRAGDRPSGGSSSRCLKPAIGNPARLQRDAQEEGQRRQLAAASPAPWPRAPAGTGRRPRRGSRSPAPAASSGSSPPRWPGSFLSRGAQALLGGVDLLEVDLDQGLSRQEPGIVGKLGQALAQRLEGRLRTGRSPPSAARARRRIRPSGSTT